MGCTAVSDGGSASCAIVVTYEGRTYQDIGAVDVPVETTGELGRATHPPCNDTGGEEDDEESWESPAYAVKGVDPTVAIAVGGSPEDATLVAVDEVEDLPAEVRELLDGS
ncbi:hypothetical protein FNH04_42160 [Streptomyces phyllanthi]|uniref:Uncharacterized protein n=1 Tax=Streptomyces phyllanthi TaxID=1803180 RepID=A0A5N8WG93_9ACTN|nr:hypothetical protein [Streptomyces phyllanthi]